MGFGRGLRMALLAGAACFGGCSIHSLARMMVSPPNNRFHSHRAAATVSADEKKEEGKFLVNVGPPAAVLACWVEEPKTLPARGTILVLHGFLANHNYVKGAADEFVKAGYRAVLVDLRGHGESTGDHVTFGVYESQDLKKVTDYLVAHKLADGHVGVYGTSLGAAVALEYAAADPRVTSVVAVASFTNLHDETPHFARTMMPLPGLFLSKDDFATLLRDAGEIGGFDPAKASPLLAITRTKAKILLVHGDLDNIIPVAQAKRLAAADPENAKLVILPGHGHLAACFDMTGHVEKLALNFFDEQFAQPSVAGVTPGENPGHSSLPAVR